MPGRLLLTAVCCASFVIAVLVTHFSDGTTQVRAWGMSIASIGFLFLVWGGMDTGDIQPAGPEKLGCAGLIIGVLLVVDGMWAFFSGNMPGGMGVPDWIKR
jgi:hypothetical protein